MMEEPVNEETLYTQIKQLYQLIETPLRATVDADYYAAARFLYYIREYGFENANSEDPYAWGKLRMVHFNYSTKDVSGGLTKHRVEIPALSLIPLPLLQINHAEFDMNIKILGTKSQLVGASKESSKSFFSERKDGLPIVDNQVYATLSDINHSKENDLAPNMNANLKIKLKMKQADIPAGISQLLNISQEASSSHSKTTFNNISFSPQEINLLDKPSKVEITLTNDSGKVLPNKAVTVNALKSGDLFNVTPEKATTDEEGKASFTFTRTKQKPGQEVIAQAAFTSEYTRKTILDIHIKPE